MHPWAIRFALIGRSPRGSCCIRRAVVWVGAREEAGRGGGAGGGDVMRGSALYRSFGCGACHAMESRGLHQGQVGPELSGFRERACIAGRLPNRPDNLVRWIADPQTVDPETAMPYLGVSSGEARDLAAYLYWDT